MKNTEQIKQFNVLQIILYHLLPGVPVLLAAVVFTNPVWGFGLPIFLSLMISFCLCLIPSQWLILVITARREGKKTRDIIGYSSKMPLSKTLLWSLPGIVLAAVIFTVGIDIENPLWRVFLWVPEWFRVNRPAPDMGNYVALTLALNFLIRGLLVPFIEEIYFRGFLLPRMNRLGKSAPIASAALFSVNHLFAPWENVTRMLAVLPFVYITWHKKNVRISLISHCTVNTLSCFMLLMSVRV